MPLVLVLPIYHRAEVAEVACQQPRLNTIVSGASPILTKSAQIQSRITMY